MVEEIKVERGRPKSGSLSLLPDHVMGILASLHMLYPEKGDLSEPHRVRSGIHLENHLECLSLVMTLHLVILKNSITIPFRQKLTLHMHPWTLQARGIYCST